MGKRVGVFVGICFAFYGVTAIVALLVWGPLSVYQSSSAFMLCLLPTLVTLIWAEWASSQSPLHQLFVVVGGMLLRMAFVLGLGLLLSLNLEWFRDPNHYAFWTWLLLYYLFTLAIEVALVMRVQRIGS